MKIELTQEQQALLEQQFATGRYHSRAEVIIEALALLNDQAQLEQAKLERLRAEIQKGLDSGAAEPLDMDSIIAEAEARQQQRSAG